MSVIIPVVISGINNGALVKGAADWNDPNLTSKGDAHLVSIEGTSNVTLKNLTVSGAKHIGYDYGSRIHVYHSTDVILRNVMSLNNQAAGLIVQQLWHTTLKHPEMVDMVLILTKVYQD